MRKMAAEAAAAAAEALPSPCKLYSTQTGGSSGVMSAASHARMHPLYTSPYSPDPTVSSAVNHSLKREMFLDVAAKRALRRIRVCSRMFTRLLGHVSTASINLSDVTPSKSTKEGIPTR